MDSKPGMNVILSQKTAPPSIMGLIYCSRAPPGGRPSGFDFACPHFLILENSLMLFACTHVHHVGCSAEAFAVHGQPTPQKASFLLHSPRKPML